VSQSNLFGMYQSGKNKGKDHEISISPEVISYISKRGCDFRISTSCFGPVLHPVKVKPPKGTDVRIRAGDYLIFVSRHQAPYLFDISMDLLMRYERSAADELV